MSIGMFLGLFLRRLFVPLGMLPLGLLLMIFGLFGVMMLKLVYFVLILLLGVLLLLATLLFLVGVSYVFVVGVLEAELLVVGALAGCIVFLRVTRLIVIVLSFLLTLLFLLFYSFVDVFSLFAGVLKGIRDKGFT